MIHSSILLIAGFSLLIFGYFVDALIVGLGLLFLINGVIGFSMFLVSIHRKKDTSDSVYNEKIFY